jgi:small ligand-binding sensory domain FIST
VLSGPVAVDVIVSQGCRPIGSVHSVTAVDENIVESLDGRPPLAAVQDMVESLSPEDRGLLRHGLFVGRAIDARKSALGRGDFLIRSVVGVDQKRGTIAVGDELTVGERIQFHVRDAATAREDLELMLSLQALLEPARGALLFSCNGRGTHLYDQPDGDVSVIQDFLGGVPLAGFFCGGEIGPIGGINFLHGHTASLAILRRAGARAERAEGREANLG